MADRLSPSTLRRELELHLSSGRCAYCRSRGTADRPLTREHLVPRSKGGGRHDHRIIVPACLRCNQRRGCQELVLFLLARPCRISALLDHFQTLPPESLREVDPQVYAELFAALWVLEDCARAGMEWQARLKRLQSGRAVHRRRYAARRIVGSAAERVARSQARSRTAVGPSCLVVDGAGDALALAFGLAEPLQGVQARLLNLLSLAWWTPADQVESVLRATRERGVGEEEEEVDIPRRPRRRKRRVRIDQRRGGVSRPRGGGAYGQRAA